MASNELRKPSVLRNVSISGSVSTISLSEKRCFIRYLNSMMESRRDAEILKNLNENISLGEWVPIGTELLESNEMYERLRDGLVFL